VLTELHGKINAEALVVSIIAGARIANIANGLDHGAIARAMPNTPAQVGAGMTVWTVSDKASAEQQEQARAILGALGEELYVAEENYLDMATALSGTGPAYVFLFMRRWWMPGCTSGFHAALHSS